jgi:hypothetical protein
MASASVDKLTAQEAVNISHLRGTAQRLAELVIEHGSYEFEGFIWLKGNLEGIAEHLGVNVKTVERIAAKPPFCRLVRRTKGDGKHTLLRLGTVPCESDLVLKLRATWVRGLAYFNMAAAQQWPLDAHHAKQAGLAYERLLKRIEKAQEWEPVWVKLKAGEPISYSVRPHEMGLLRECVRRLGDDAFRTVACLTSWHGWRRFMSYAKTAERVVEHHYHWPTLGPITANPDIALQAYLDTKQAQQDIDLKESARLIAKIDSLTPVV